MTKQATRSVRCAIYTRKSTEHGLELEFNSLDAQREACEAYIKSQTHEGWAVLLTRYDDPAYSGGNLERPALQRLLTDIDAGLIDVIVVYKIDRLTRSLADFAKLVDAFDAKSISFVAVTQQFNTTTSMGRLTLNVLLSFAQFERELSSERVRDKIAASRKKGKWTGGGVPLGYVNQSKKLVIDPVGAETVRMIFSRYLALGSFQKLIDELNRKSIVTGTRNRKDRKCNGIPFTYGPLAYLLKNRVYLGEIGHKGSWFAGEHAAIVNPEVFDAAQALLKTNSAGRTGARAKNNTLLAGLLFDDNGNRMSPSFSVKKGARYGFYVSAALLNGRKAQAGSIKRASMMELETAVKAALARHFSRNKDGYDNLTVESLRQLVNRIEIGKSQVTIELRKTDAIDSSSAIVVPWAPAARGPKAIIEVLTGMGANPNEALVKAIARSNAWLSALSDGTCESIDALAQLVDLHPKVIRKQLRLAFLAPELVRACLCGNQPSHIRVRTLCDIAQMDWHAQLNSVGMSA